MVFEGTKAFSSASSEAIVHRRESANKHTRRALLEWRNRWLSSCRDPGPLGFAPSISQNYLDQQQIMCGGVWGKRTTSISSTAGVDKSSIFGYRVVFVVCF